MKVHQHSLAVKFRSKVRDMVLLAPPLHAVLTSLTAIVTCPAPNLAPVNFVLIMEAPVPPKRPPTLLFPTDSTTSTQSAAKISPLLATRSATL